MNLQHRIEQIFGKLTEYAQGKGQPTNALPDFKDRNSTGSNEFAYDANGNLTRDDNKGITNIFYNFLNKPCLIEFGPNRKIEYFYSSTGVKLTKRVTVSNGSSSSVTRTDYVGEFIYLNNVLSSVSLDDGRLVKNASGVFESQYYLKDHLGNVRVVYGADSQGNAVELQEDHYYPYGMTMSGLSIVSSLANNYKYQGKEYQPEGFDTDGNSTLDTYLAWSDFDARFFDPQLGRWHVPDPANQYASPYVGMGNNPANRVDPDGREDNASPVIRRYWRDFFDRILAESQRSVSIDNMVWGCGNYGAYEGTRHDEIKRWIEKHYQGSTGSGDVEEFLKRGNNWEKVYKLRIRNITLVEASSIDNKQGNTTAYVVDQEGTEMMLYCDIEISNEYFKGNDRIGIAFQLTLAHELIHVADYQYNWDNLKQLDKYARLAIMEKRVANILNDSNVRGSYLPQSYITKYESWENVTNSDFNKQKNRIYDHKDLISIFNKAYKYVWEGDNINAFDPFTIEWK